MTSPQVLYSSSNNYVLNVLQIREEGKKKKKQPLDLDIQST